MAATYDETEPTAKDRARGLLGDVNVPDGALHSDEHILAMLAQQIGAGAYELGVATLADQLVARVAQDPSRVSLPSGLSVDYAKRIEAWQDLAARMRAEAATKVATAEEALKAAGRRAQAGRLAAGLDWRPR